MIEGSQGRPSLSHSTASVSVLNERTIHPWLAISTFQEVLVKTNPVEEHGFPPGVREVGLVVEVVGAT